MTDKVMENNQVTVMGEIVGEFVYSHEIFGEGFYMVDILVPRLSDSSDRIPLMISERLMDVSKDYRGTLVMVSGQFRSYNRHEEHRNRLILSVFVREVALNRCRKMKRQIIFFWTDSSVRSLFTGKHRLEEKSRIFCWL